MSERRNAGLLSPAATMNLNVLVSYRAGQTLSPTDEPINLLEPG